MERAEIKHVHPKKKLGQHFLRSKEIAQRIVDALEATSGNTIIEIGAGTGELTRLIVKQAARLVAVEVDEACFPTLRVLAELNKNLELFLEDIRNLDLSGYGSGYGSVFVLGNLPYHLSGEILFWLLGQRKHWRGAVLTLQSEFADRLTAAVGSHDYSSLSVITQTFASVEKLFDIPASAFVPPPRVTSSTVRLKPLEGVKLPVAESEFMAFVRSCFLHRRKTLANNLKMAGVMGVMGVTSVTSVTSVTGVTGVTGVNKADKILTELGFDNRVRPQELSTHDYIRLVGAIS